MRTTTLKPGLLVSLKTRIIGGVEYQRADLTPPTDAPQGADAKRWETTRIVEDPDAWESARATRSKAQSLIRGACIKSDFGLLCPVSLEAKLKDKIDEAQALAEKFNDGPQQIRVEVYVVSGRVADSDEQAARAIASEIRGLLDGMNQGIAEADPEAIRQAANRARNLGAMLDEESAGRVKKAIVEAREVAKAIVKRVKGGGEVAEKVIAEFKLEALQAARFAFLDMDAPKVAACGEEQLPSIDAGRVAGLDLETPAVAPTATPSPAGAPQRDIEF